MKNLQRTGGFAALIEALIYVVAVVYYFAILDFPADPTPAQWFAFLEDNYASMAFMNLFTYVLFGVVQIVLSVAIYERLKTGSPALARIATAFGLIWAGIVIASGMIANIGMAAVISASSNDPDLAMSASIAINAVTEGLGGGNEIVGALWVLLLSWAAFRTGDLPKPLNCVGILVGVTGILTAFQPEVLTEIFGLSQIAWFVWLGILMLRSRQA